MPYSKQLCVRSQHALDILGKRWTGLILLALMEKPLRFNELGERIEVVSDKMLSQRLKELEAEGLVERRVLAERPVQVEYALTEKGCALQPILDAVREWSHAWIPLPDAVATDE